MKTYALHINAKGLNLLSSPKAIGNPKGIENISVNKNTSMVVSNPFSMSG